VLHKAGDVATTAAVLGDCLEALRIIALLASPVIPNAAAELWRRLGRPGAPEEQRLPDAAVWGSAATAGNPLEKGPSLFPRIDSP
jgi:methionyl-tRNA synthetase